MSRNRIWHRTYSTSFILPASDHQAKERLLSFWSRRGFTCSEKVDGTLVGRRGSIRGNLLSFDMSRLITELTVSVDPSNCCTCTLDVCTIFQVIAPWNEAHWLLELETAESYVLHSDMKTQVWYDLGQQSKQNDRRWTLYAVIIGSASFAVIRALVGILRHFLR